MKFIFLSLLAFAVGAQAQYRPITLIDGGTNKVLALATNTYESLATLDVSRQAEVAIQIDAAPNGSNYVDLRLDFMRSVNGSGWVNTNFISVFTKTATNDICPGVICIVSNVPVPGLMKLKLFRIANLDNHAIATNLTVSYGVKRLN